MPPPESGLVVDLDAIPSLGDEPEAPYYPHVGGFVEGYLLPNWRHPLGMSKGVNWCPRWWAHAEAISRLEALWLAWEGMRVDPPPAMSVWWRDHADPHMAALTSQRGPFGKCRLDHHENIPTWPSDPCPAGLFGLESVPAGPGHVQDSRVGHQ